MKSIFLGLLLNMVLVGCNTGTTVEEQSFASTGISGFCSSNDECRADYYCFNFYHDCGGLGICRPRATNCTTDEEPVCGCDGQTYSNSCQASEAGTSVDHMGRCDRHCQSNWDCPYGKYCKKDFGSCDGTGRCSSKPEVCFILWDPVCGCNGNTFSNECAASQVSINVDYSGECQF